MKRDLNKLAKVVREEVQNFALKHSFGYGIVHLGGYCAVASYILTIVARRLGYKAIFIEGIAFDRLRMDSYLSLLDKKTGEKHSVEKIGIVYSPEDLATHCWVEIGDWLIDLTASQFDRQLKPVHIIRRDSADYKAQYLPITKHTQALNRVKTSWQTDQSPYEYMPDIKSRIDFIVNKLLG